MNYLVLIAGPSGAGKTTISRYLKEKYQIPRVITHTTRPKRIGEIDGTDYHFETTASMRNLHFFEKVTYGGYEYGSSKESLDQAWRKNKIVSLIVDTKGVETYLEKLPKESFFIYVTVTDLKVIEERLKKRGDNEAQIMERLKSEEFIRDLTLPSPLKQVAHYVFNDDLKQAKTQVDHYIENLRKDE